MARIKAYLDNKSKEGVPSNENNARPRSESSSSVLSIQDKDLAEKVDTLTVASLRKQLKKRSLPTDGKKAELVSRVKEYLHQASHAMEIKGVVGEVAVNGVQDLLSTNDQNEFTGSREEEEQLYGKEYVGLLQEGSAASKPYPLASAFRFRMCESIPTCAPITSIAVGERLAPEGESFADFARSVEERESERIDEECEKAKALGQYSEAAQIKQNAKKAIAEKLKAELGSSSDQDAEVVVGCGRGKNGGLCALSSSLRSEISTELPMEGCSGMWAVVDAPGESNGAQNDAYIILTQSTQDSASTGACKEHTRILCVKEALNELSEDASHGFHLSSPTLCAGNMCNGSVIVQTLASGIRFISKGSLVLSIDRVAPIADGGLGLPEDVGIACCRIHDDYIAIMTSSDDPANALRLVRISKSSNASSKVSAHIMCPALSDAGKDLPIASLSLFSTNKDWCSVPRGTPMMVIIRAGLTENGAGLLTVWSLPSLQQVYSSNAPFVLGKKALKNATSEEDGVGGIKNDDDLGVLARVRLLDTAVQHIGASAAKSNATFIVGALNNGDALIYQFMDSTLVRVKTGFIFRGLRASPDDGFTPLRVREELKHENALAAHYHIPLLHPFGCVGGYSGILFSGVRPAWIVVQQGVLNVMPLTTGMLKPSPVAVPPFMLDGGVAPAAGSRILARELDARRGFVHAFTPFNNTDIGIESGFMYQFDGRLSNETSSYRCCLRLCQPFAEHKGGSMAARGLRSTSTRRRTTVFKTAYMNHASHGNEEEAKQHAHMPTYAILTASERQTAPLPSDGLELPFQEPSDYAPSSTPSPGLAFTNPVLPTRWAVELVQANGWGKHRQNLT